MSLGPNDISVTVTNVTPEVQAVVAPVSTISVVTEAPEILIVGTAALGPQGERGTVGPFRQGHTFAVLGALGALELPAFFVPKSPNQIVEAVGAWGVIVSGGSIDLQFILNGADAGPVITLTPVQQYFPFVNRVLADGDKIAARLSRPVGTPSTLTCTIVLEWSVQ